MKPHYWLVTYKYTQTQNAMSYNEGYCAVKSLNTGKPLLDEIREYLPSALRTTPTLSLPPCAT